MDSKLIPEGVQRCSFGQFVLWISSVGVVLAIGVYAMILCWLKGLNQSNMNDAYGFALWIWADLAVIALGGGAFFSGFLKYIVGVKELKNIINSSVLMSEKDVLEKSIVNAILDLKLEKNTLPAEQVADTQSLKFQLSSLEKKILTEALSQYRSTREVAKRLNLSQSSVVRKLKLHGIVPE